ncbi:MAG: apolipoprotein N-acyltransferase, partial [Polyangiales bacterium]
MTSPVTSPLPLRLSIALSILSGFLYFLAFPGVDVWPLAFLCWAPLLVAIEGQTPKRALFLGWVHGVTSVCCGFRFLLATLKTFAGFPFIFCLGIFLILAAYQALSFGTIAFLYGRARAKGWPAGLVFGLSVAASEQAFPLLFPYYAGAQLHTVPRLIQIVDLGGPIAASVALAGGSVAVAELVWSRIQLRAIDRRRVALALIGPALIVVYGSIRLAQVDRAIAAAPSA